MSRHKNRRKAGKVSGGLAPDKYLSEGQIKQFRRHLAERVCLADARGSRIRAYMNQFIYEVLLRSGLRASELCDLNLEDLPGAHGKDAVYVRNGKGNISRTVEITPQTVDLINTWVKHFRPKAGPQDPLLMSEQGGRLSYHSLFGKIKRIGEAVGIDLHPHMLRHSYAMRLYAIEADLRAVQQQLGHSDPITTAIYAKTSPEALKRQIAKIEDNGFTE